MKPLVGIPRVSVVVTTYERVEPLAGCLDGLRSQTQQAHEVVVVVHKLDEPSARLVDRMSGTWPELRRVQVDRHGSVPALNCGLAAARGAVVAIVDDDAVPAADWLERIVGAFDQDGAIAAVGGRDVVIRNGRAEVAPRRRILRRDADALDVGRIQWFGRMIANHHIAAGHARDVDVLKGVNMSFRRAAVVRHGFDERLRGRGAQVHSELSICLPLRRQGFRIVYDPSIVVLHYPAPRPHGDHRGALDLELAFAAAHNEALAILDYFGPLRRLVFMSWGLAVGTTDAPGLAVMARDLLTRRPAAGRRFIAAQRGHGAAWMTRRTPRSRPAVLAAAGPTTGQP